MGDVAGHCRTAVVDPFETYRETFGLGTVKSLVTLADDEVGTLFDCGTACVGIVESHRIGFACKRHTTVAFHQLPIVVGTQDFGLRDPTVFLVLVKRICGDFRILNVLYEVVAVIDGLEIFIPRVDTFRCERV